MQKNTSQKLFDLLLSKDFDIKTLDSNGKFIADITDADIFSFDFISNTVNYGTVVILLSDDGAFEIFFGDNIGRGLERDAKNTWYDLLYQLRMFAKRNMMSFSLKNINKLKHTMQGLATIKEGLYEGWNGTSKSSYNPQNNKTKLIIRHSKKIAEGDQRFRNINSIFIENGDGERFKLPFKSIAGARAMARHVSEGNTPYDVFGVHITETINNINTLGSFLRVKSINEGTASSKIIETCQHHNKRLKKNIKLMSGVRGYKKYIESWSPSTINEDEQIIEKVRNLLVPEGASDDRVNDVLPVLANLISEYRARKTETNESKTETNESLKVENSTMRELTMFESWANNITEGTWALPDSPEALDRLKEILSKELLVGVDATNATEVLYDIIGDDELFDNLADLARDDPEADARFAIVNWMKDYGLEINEMGSDMKNIITDIEGSHTSLSI
jgi:hypothetical protein